MVFTTTRTTLADPAGLLAAVRTALNDGTVTVSGSGFGFYPPYVVDRAMPLNSDDIIACQQAIDTAPAATPQTDAQAEIDRLPIVWKAIALALLDQLNVLRVRAGLAEITPQQAIAGIRAKAGTL